METAYPGMNDRLCKGGELSPALQVSIDGTFSRRGLDARVQSASEVHFLPVFGGGVNEALRTSLLGPTLIAGGGFVWHPRSTTSMSRSFGFAAVLVFVAALLCGGSIQGIQERHRLAGAAGD